MPPKISTPINKQSTASNSIQSGSNDEVKSLKIVIAKNIQNTSTDSTDWIIKTGKHTSSPGNSPTSKAKNNNHKKFTYTTPNRYETLNVIDDETNNENDVLNDQIQTENVIQPPTPPPIFITTQVNYQNFCNQIKTLVGNEDFLCKTTTKNLKLILKSPQSFRQVIKLLNDNSVEYFINQAKEEKFYRVVLKHLHHKTPTELIIQDLEDLGFSSRLKNLIPDVIFLNAIDAKTRGIRVLTAIDHLVVKIQININSAKKPKVIRKYSDNYLSFGFFWTGNEEEPLPLCVVCGEKLSNSSMAPSKLNRHLITNHSHLESKDQNYFKELMTSQSKQKKYFEKKVTVSDKAQIASYKVAELIAQKTKPHSIAESLILPLFSEIVKIMLGDEASNEISKIPLSNDTIRRRIIDMSVDIEENVNKNLINTNFALQIDESTDISGKAQLIGFIRFIHDNKISNQFLFCKELIKHTKGQDIFEIVNSYFKQSNISWKMCVGICTDGAPSMVGSVKGFITLA
ncbi:hypothetical protein QTP88_014077 [Uroleucon formosanum]